LKKKRVSLRANYLQTINEIIKGELFPFYILLGNSFYLKNQILEKIKNILKVEKVNVIDGELEKKEILDIIESPSFFFTTLLFYIKDADKIDNFRWEEFNSRKNRVIVFEDKQGKIPPPPIYLEDKVKYVYESLIDENILKKWVIKKFDENGKKIDDRAVSKLIFELQNDIDLLFYEIEKLSLLDKDEINEEDIDIYSYKINIPNVFDIISSYLKGRKRKFLNSIEDLIQKGEPFEKVFYILLSKVLNLLDIKVATLRGFNEKELRENLKLSQNQISFLINEAKEYSYEELYNFLNELLEIEKRIKLSKGYLREKIELDLINR
jgi:DNA polymerase-3 subunit delta